MNKLLRYLAFSLVAAATISFAAGVYAQGKPTPAGEQFFIVASIDQAKSQLLLKRPTEVTLLAHVNAKTQVLDENGKPIHLADLRTGDTVWVVSSTSAGETIASRIRKGSMTVDDLHKYYLDYPEIK
ncbi:MAG: hypothetical protein ACRD4Q_12275 [Candidatus Acidiferrales bacterium]